MFNNPNCHSEPFAFCHCYENRVFPVRPEPVEGPFMVRQAHHERRPAHLFSLSVVPIIGMIDSERSEESETLPLHGACPDEGRVQGQGDS